MNQKKSLQELTFKDNFMFGAVLLDPENCKGVIERSIGTEIERVEVSKEKSIVYNPEYKGVRLDAYEELPDTYVIFICDFDPFGAGKYRYTRKTSCKEVPELEMDDGAHTIFLSTKGTNEDEEPEELVKFLKFVGAKPSESEKDFEDAFIQRLQKSVKEVKVSREMGARYMTFQELLKDERAEGKAEGKAENVLDLLQELGVVSEELQKRIMNERDLTVLTKWVKIAAKSDTIDEFIGKM